MVDCTKVRCEDCAGITSARAMSGTFSAPNCRLCEWLITKLREATSPEEVERLLEECIDCAVTEFNYKPPCMGGWSYALAVIDP